MAQNNSGQGMNIQENDRVPDLAKEFISIFSEYSYNNIEYGLLLYHTILGEILKTKKIPKGSGNIDPRFHLFLIQDSGTGKSAPLPLVMDMCSDLNINFNSLDEATDAGLVGTIEKSEYTDDEGNTQTEYEVEKGVLATADIIHFDEGSNIFKQSNHNKNMLSYFQKAMNTIGNPESVITKEMAHGKPIEVNPDCSFFITSYMPPNIEETIIRTGFFQRITVLPRDVDLNTRRDNSRKDASKIGTTASTEAEYENIVGKLEEIENFYIGEDEEDEGHDIKINDKIRKVFENEADNLYDKLQGADRATRRILASFVPRLQNKMYILAYHSAASDKRTNVTAKDVWYASDVINYVFSNMITWLEMRMNIEERTGMKREKKYWQDIMRNWGGYFEDEENENGYVSSNVLKKHLPNILGVTESTAREYIRIFDNERNWFKSQKISKTKYYKPNELKAPAKPNRKNDN